MQVHGGHPDIAVSHELLELGDIAAAVEHIDGEGMAELMQMEVHSGTQVEIGDGMLEPITGQPGVLVGRYEKVGARAVSLLPFSEILGQVQEHHRVKRDSPVSSRFRGFGADQNRLSFQVDVEDPQIEELAAPQSAAEKQREYGQVPFSEKTGV